MSKRLAFTLFFLFLLLITIIIAKLLEINKEVHLNIPIQNKVFIGKKIPKRLVLVNDTVRIERYFSYMDSLVTGYDSLTQYPLSEHILVKSNPWIIDTLANTDYYSMMQRDSFVYDQRKMIVIKPKDRIIIPDSLEAYSIIEAFGKTRIDINLPEYKLRVYDDSMLVSTYLIRIGQNKKKYLKMGERLTDLKTKQGIGQIIGYRKNPDFYNPETGKQFFVTRRDDDKTTLMPQIPWIVTEIDGIRNGQLIHPTTNPNSLGKAYSNGCIGVKESDAWRIYYQCPIGTKINIRYDLKVLDDSGTEFLLNDIYKLGV
jgi:L,D-transpeptidase ErfK/SrfK